MLGFDALGRLALGQLPRLQAPLPFTKWTEAVLTKSAARLADTKGFIGPVVQVVRVFPSFSQPTSVRPPQDTQPTLRQQSTAAAAATPTALVFSSFSQPSKPAVQSGFTNAPIVLAVQPTVFSKFSEPSKTTFKNSDVINVPVFITPTATVVTGGDFADFDLPIKTKVFQSAFSNSPIFVPDAVVFQPYVFTDYADLLPSKKPQQGFTNAPLFTAQQPYIFSSFSQPSPKVVPLADKLFVGDLGPAQTPTWSTFPQFKELLTKKPQQDPSIGFIGDLGPAQTPSRLAFADFEGIPSRRPLEGYITSTSPPAVQNYVFSKFDQPVYKRIIQPDQSFVNFPVVVAAVQPYLFSDFGQPQQTKRPIIDDRSFLNFPVVPAAVQPYVFSRFEQPPANRRTVQDWQFIGDRGPAQTPTSLVFAGFEGITVRRPLEGYLTSAPTPSVQNYVFSKFDQPTTRRVLQPDTSFVNFPVVVVAQQPYVFGQFDQPQFKRPLLGDFGNNTPEYVQAVVQNYSFGLFSQPLLVKPRVDGFTNTPDFIAVQPYVFGQFDQPRQLIRVVPGFTNNQTFIAPQSYVFSRFEQPFSQKTLQIDSVQFVDNTPTVVVLTPDFSYSDFGIPFYSKQTGISFTNSPLQQIVAPDNSAPFSGFTSFVIQLPGQYHIEQHPGVVYEILVPDVLVEDVIISGKRWKVQTRQSPKTISVVSSNIAEVTFDKDSNELNVKFNNGKVYNYANIDSKKAKGLVRAKSSGKYLHNNIKGKYHTTRIK